MKRAKYKIVFCGSALISQKIASALHEIDFCEIVGVVTQPDKAKNRQRKYKFNAVKTWAMQENLLLFQPTHLKTIYADLKALQVDALVTCAYGQIIPASFLNLVNKRAYNFHASWLPFYRGGAPVQRCLWDQQRMSGMSLMLMEPTLDTGSVFVQLPYVIKENETTTSLLEELGDLGVHLVQNYLELVLANQITAVEQNHHQATYAPNITNSETWIDWEQPCLFICQQIQALADEPGALTTCDHIIYKMYSAIVLRQLASSELKYQNGMILGVEQKYLAVKTKDGVLGISVMQKAGKKRGLAASYHFTPFASFFLRENKL